jgi:hypothetical protein
MSFSRGGEQLWSTRRQTTRLRPPSDFANHRLFGRPQPQVKSIASRLRLVQGALSQAPSRVARGTTRARGLLLGLDANATSPDFRPVDPSSCCAVDQCLVLGGKLVLERAEIVLPLLERARAGDWCQ